MISVALVEFLDDTKVLWKWLIRVIYLAKAADVLLHPLGSASRDVPKQRQPCERD